MNNYIEILKNTINELDIDLKNLVVLTEAANGSYSSTCILSLLAGAKVYAFSKYTKYGSPKIVFKDIINILKNNNINGDIEFITKLSPNIISECDIITNCGQLRPLNNNLLKHTKQGVVIPLMYESWELRKNDIDIQYCIDNYISVAGTNECHPNVAVFDYLGEMAIKLIENSGVSAERNDFILISNNKFGSYIAKTLLKVCNRLGIIDTKMNKNNYKFSNKCVWLSNFPKINIDRTFYNSKRVIFTAYPFEKEWISASSTIKPQLLKDNLLNPFLLRFAGDVNTNDLLTHKINYYPHNVKSGHMGILPSCIGYEPIIRLQAGGLKVGQELISKNFKSEYLQMIVNTDEL